MPEWIIMVLDKVVLSLLIGITTSAMFMFLLSRFRPVISISKSISKRFDKDLNRSVFAIKVINRNRYPLIDIKVELVFRKPVQTATGEVWRVKTIPLRRSELLSLPEFNKKDLDAKYAYRFATDQDFISEWNDEYQKVTFKIFAKHSLTGFGAYFEQDYPLKRSCIKEGVFSKGDSFEIH